MSLNPTVTTREMIYHLYPLYPSLHSEMTYRWVLKPCFPPEPVFADVDRNRLAVSKNRLT